MSYNKHILYINSKYRRSGESSTSFTVDVRSKLQNVSRIVPYSFSMVNSFYNVRNEDNTLNITVDSVEYVVVVPIGYYQAYGADNITDTIQALITLQVAGVTVSISKLTGKMKFSHNTLDLQVLNTSTILNTIGFLGTEVASTDIIGSDMIDLRGLSKVFIHANFAQNHFITESGDVPNPLGEDVVLAVDMTSGFGETTNFTNDDEVMLGINIPTSDISTFQVYITDEDNNPVDTYGFDWNMSFTVINEQ